jgi:hypothetical protein
MPGRLPLVKIYFVLCLVKEFWFFGSIFTILLKTFEWIFLSSFTRPWNFKYVLDLSLNCCSRVHVLLNYDPPTGLWWGHQHHTYTYTITSTTWSYYSCSRPSTQPSSKFILKLLSIIFRQWRRVHSCFT